MGFLLWIKMIVSQRRAHFDLLFKSNLAYLISQDAGWSSLVARQAHNLKAAGSNPAPATTLGSEL
jgi:hypothetical protein